ncbi:hypothetical protein UFOVP935_31 [uncultured Caudovirales phage]|uniref:Uncharacterized protein n=1 Tax=uncultured Caudovirales phage TaxID=2100421 RepID=A0A6J5PTW5_9CAUD|nr:hypothetical protein UFOVP935_31 [uncultured Caudovirales phage]
MMRSTFFSSFAAALSLAAAGSGIPLIHRPNFAMPSGVDILDAPQTSTSSTRRNRNTVAAAKREALKTKRRKAHKARCR